MSKLAKWAIPLGIVLVLGMWWVGTANTLVRMDEGVAESFAKIQTALQRRHDLVMQTIPLIDRYANHEQKTFIETARARAAAVRPPNATGQQIAQDPKLQEQLQQSQQAMNAVIPLVMQAFSMVRESNPNLKAIRLFERFQNDITGTENRIRVARDDAQKAVRAYNTQIRTFPSSLVAQVHGYQPRVYYRADENSQQAPEIKFNQQ